MNGKKILIVTIHPLYPVSHGGIVRVVEVAKFLSNNGYDVHLIGNWTKPENIKKTESIIGAKIYTFSYPAYLTSGMLNKLGSIKNGWIYNPLIGRDLEKLIRNIRPDIVQCEFLHAANHVANICKKYDLPFILTEHNVEYGRLAMEGLGSIDILKEIEKDICNKADCVVAVSPNDRAELRKIGVEKDIILIPNGVSCDRFAVDQAGRSKMREQFGIKPDDIVFIYHGTLNYKPNKIADKILKETIFPTLQAKHGNLKLLLIGPGRNDSIHNGIIEISEVPFDELPIYLSMGDIGLIPLTEGSGTRLKIIEYLALGIPVVSTKIGAEGLPLTDGVDALISIDEKDEFITKALRLIEDQQLRSILGKNGHQVAIVELEWNAVLKQYISIYNYLSKTTFISE